MPRPGVKIGPPSPVWSRLVVKVPPPCSVCLQNRHAEWGTGVPFTGIPRARQRRQTGPGEYEDFCNDHAEELKKLDDAAKKPVGNYTGWAKRKSTR